MSKEKWLLGALKDSSEKVYLYDFEWSCDWYWGGGYIGNRNFHAHFDSCFLNVPDSRGHSLGNFFDPWTKLPDYLEEKDIWRIDNGAAVWEDLTFFLYDAQYSSAAWWRLKDLFKQFYALKEAAAVYRHGGHCTSRGRTDAETVPIMATLINTHIEKVIIPEIRNTLNTRSVRAIALSMSAQLKGVE